MYVSLRHYLTIIFVISLTYLNLDLSIHYAQYYCNSTQPNSAYCILLSIRSWVNRSADPSKTKKRATCRHCNSYFVPSKKEQCSAIVGFHEANVVLKDNDMRTKISLEPTVARKIVDTLLADSELLGKLGVLDYSLLVGVKKMKFPVSVTDDLVSTCLLILYML